MTEHGRLIDADTLIKSVEKESQVDGAYGYMDTKSIVDLIENASTIEPKRKKGERIVGEKDVGALGIEYTELICSNCGFNTSLLIPRNFCPCCGADMRGEESDNE